MVQVVAELPAGTVTEVGIDVTAEAPLRILSVTVMSTAAGAFKVTLPVVLSPPTTEDGEAPTADGSGGVRVTVFETL
jgi:hypothetical protein